MLHIYLKNMFYTNKSKLDYKQNFIIFFKFGIIRTKQHVVDVSRKRGPLLLLNFVLLK